MFNIKIVSFVFERLLQISSMLAGGHKDRGLISVLEMFSFSTAALY